MPTYGNPQLGMGKSWKTKDDIYSRPSQGHEDQTVSLPKKELQTVLQLASSQRGRQTGPRRLLSSPNRPAYPSQLPSEHCLVLRSLPTLSEEKALLLLRPL
jgi:hypothetical protein